MIADAQDDLTGSLDIWSGRATWSGLGGLELMGEYVIENGGNDIDADGWYGQAAWNFADTAWLPWVGYRYAAFDGDNPDTAEDERFREIAYDYTDYGSWFQGEITGSYPLANGNVTSHMFRLKTNPVESLTLNLFWFDFSLDHPGSLAPGVTSDDWGQEINLIADWAVNDNWYVIGSAGVLSPGDAAEQWVGGDENWYNLYIRIDIEEVKQKEGDTDFTIDDVKKCYIKFKKYNEAQEVIGQLAKNVDPKEIDQEFIVNLKLEVDEMFGEGDDEFKIET